MQAIYSLLCRLSDKLSEINYALDLMKQAQQAALNRLTHLKLNRNQAAIISEYHQSLNENKRAGVRIGLVPHFKELGLPLPLSPGYINVMLEHTKLPKMINFMTNTHTIQAQELHPAELRDKFGRILLNLWNFARVYPKVYAIDRGGWCYPATVHYDGDIQNDYWQWRREGSEMDTPVYDPNGTKSWLWEKVLWPIDYVDYPELIDRDKNRYHNVGGLVEVPREAMLTKMMTISYKYLAKQTNSYRLLLDLLRSGKRVQLLTRDAPHTILKPDGTPYFNVCLGLPGQWWGCTMEIDKSTKHKLSQMPWYPPWVYVLACCLIDDM